MLGWHVSVYRKAHRRGTPASFASRQGQRLAVWQGGLEALEWLDELVRSGDARALGGDGYPLRFTAAAHHIVPVIVAGPPHAREVWEIGEGHVIDSTWAGRTVIDHAAIDTCGQDEWLLIEAWDES